MAEALLEVSGLRKSFWRAGRAVAALDGVALRVPAGTTLALAGASGSGKSTLARCILRLTEPDAGSVRFAGTELLGLAPAALRAIRPRVQMVFQDPAAAFNPRASVARILADPLRVNALAPRGEWRARALALLDMVRLPAALIDRRSDELSGGQRQRVAIARALAASPRLLLMDEPLAALDAARKAEVMPYLERLQRSLDIPVLYVSHSPDEVARLASHLVLLQAGRVTAQGPTAELMARLDLPLAHGDAAATLVQGRVLAHDAQDHLLTVGFKGARIHLVSSRARAEGESVRLRVLARDVSLARTRARDSSILNLLPVRITQLADEGPGQVLVALDMAGTTLLARITRRSCRTLALAVGDVVYAQVKGVALVD